MKLNTLQKRHSKQIKLIPQTYSKQYQTITQNPQRNNDSNRTDAFFKLNLESKSLGQIQKLKEKTQLQRKMQSVVKQMQNLHNQIVFQILNGQIVVRNRPKNFKRKEPEPQIKQQVITLRQKIDMLNQDLLNIRQSIIQEKTMEKKYHQQKQREAAELVHRLRVEKYEFKKKAKFIDVQHRVKDRAFSESIVKMMKSETEKRLQRKKQEIQDRIQSINRRKEERLQNAHQIQEEYIDKVKKMEQFKEKRSFSSSRLVLPKLQQNLQAGNDDKKSGMLLGHPIFKSKVTDWDHIKQHNKNYQNKIKKLVLYKHSHSKSQAVLQNDKLQQIYAKQKERKERYEQGNRMLEESLKITKPQTSPRYKVTRNSVNLVVFSENKTKQQGNLYMKEALAKARASKLRSRSRGDGSFNSIDVQQTIQLKANYLPIVRNQQLSQLSKKYNETLEQMRSGKVDKMRGLYLLAIVQKKLDKMDPENITQRLTEKLAILNVVQKSPQSRVKEKTLQSQRMKSEQNANK